MGFVYRSVRDDERQLPCYHLFTRWGKPILPDKWTADPDRGAYFVRSFTDREPPHDLNFILILDQTVVYATFSIEQMKTDALGKWKYTYKLKSLSIPDGSTTPEVAVRNMLREALTAYGIYGDHQHIAELNFDF